MVALRSSHMSEIAWCRGDDHDDPSGPRVGGTPSSLGPVPKMSHASASSVGSVSSEVVPSVTHGHWRTSRKKARVAGASSEYTRLWMAVIMGGTLRRETAARHTPRGVARGRHQ